AFQQGLDQRVVLPLLERFPRLVFGVAVVEAADVTQRDAVAIEVIDEAAAIGARVGRPAEAVHDLAGRGAAGGHLPQLLDADGIALRVAVRIQLEALDELLGEAAARALGQYSDLGLDVDAFGVAGLVRAVFGHAHV